MLPLLEWHLAMRPCVVFRKKPGHKPFLQGQGEKRREDVSTGINELACKGRRSRASYFSHVMPGGNAVFSSKWKISLNYELDYFR